MCSWGYPSPLKIHPAGVRLLQKDFGWVQVLPGAATGRPAFGLLSRSALQKMCTAPKHTRPLVRQLPPEATEQLDDKRLLAAALAAAHGGAELAFSPRTHLDLAAFVRWLDLPRIASEQQRLASRQLFFVKHYRGVKGQAVHPEVGAEAVLVRLSKGSSRDWYVVQEEAGPPMLLEGRKFGLRAHCLALFPAATGGRSTRSSSSAWVHMDLIVTEHSASYGPTSLEVAAHVSQAGRGHPVPCLLAARLPELQTAVAPQLLSLAAKTLAAWTDAEGRPRFQPARVADGGCGGRAGEGECECEFALLVGAEQPCSAGLLCSLCASGPPLIVSCT